MNKKTKQRLFTKSIKKLLKKKQKNTILGKIKMQILSMKMIQFIEINSIKLNKYINTGGSQPIRLRRGYFYGKFVIVSVLIM